MIDDVCSGNSCICVGLSTDINTCNEELLQFFLLLLGMLIVLDSCDFSCYVMFSLLSSCKICMGHITTSVNCLSCICCHLSKWLCFSILLMLPHQVNIYDCGNISCLYVCLILYVCMYVYIDIDFIFKKRLLTLWNDISFTDMFFGLGRGVWRIGFWSLLRWLSLVCSCRSRRPSSTLTPVILMRRRLIVGRANHNYFVTMELFVISSLWVRYMVLTPL